MRGRQRAAKICMPHGALFFPLSKTHIVRHWSNSKNNNIDNNNVEHAHTSAYRDKSKPRVLLIFQENLNVHWSLEWGGTQNGSFAQKCVCVCNGLCVCQCVCACIKTSWIYVFTAKIILRRVRSEAFAKSLGSLGARSRMLWQVCLILIKSNSKWSC